MKGDDGAFLLKETEFKHPLYLTLLMFLGEASLLIVLRFMHRADPVAALVHERGRANPLMFVAPAFIDLCASFLSFTALAFIVASSYQILKMLCMVFVVVLSVLVLRRQYTVVQYLAVATVIGGLTVVTLTDIYFKPASASEDTADSSLVLLGIVCMVFAQFFHAGQCVLEEYILKAGGG